MTGLYGMSGGIEMKISKNKIMITAIIVLCVAVAVLAAVLVIRKDKNKDNDDKFTPTIDSDSGEIGTGVWPYSPRIIPLNSLVTIL